MIAHIRRDHKLLVTIVKRDQAKKVMKAAKKAGCEGGTIMLASGIGVHEKKKIFSIDTMYEKDVVFNLVPEDLLPDVIKGIDQSVKLNKAGRGIGFVIDILKTVGMVHMDYEEVEKGALDVMTDDVRHDGFDLIITIVNKGDASEVIDASKLGGAEGGTVINARGSGIHEKAKLLSINIEPEKELVLTIVKRSITKDVLQAIEREVHIDEPGKGIGFVLPVEETIGMPHLSKLK